MYNMIIKFYLFIPFFPSYMFLLYKMMTTTTNKIRSWIVSVRTINKGIKYSLISTFKFIKIMKPLLLIVV